LLLDFKKQKYVVVQVLRKLSLFKKFQRNFAHSVTEKQQINEKEETIKNGEKSINPFPEIQFRPQTNQNYHQWQNQNYQADNQKFQILFQSLKYSSNHSKLPWFSVVAVYW